MISVLSRLKSSCLGSQLIAEGTTQGRAQAQALTLDDLALRCDLFAEEFSRNKTKLLALHADNSIDWLVIDLACQQAGICLVPLPTFFSTEQLRHVFDSAAIDGLICENPELFERMFNNSVEHHRVELPGNFGMDSFAFYRITPTANADALPPETGKITFTSGSTGKPKGVCLSNQQLVRQAEALAETLSLTSPRHLCLLPLSTLLENVAGNYTPLFSGGHVVIPSLTEIGFEGSSSVNPTLFIGMIDRVKPNSIILTPQLLTLLVAVTNQGWKPSTSLTFVAVGGGKVSTELLQRAQLVGIPVFEGYGLSECTSVVSLNTPNDYRHTSSGKPLSHLELQIIDGEIVVSGNTMLGYLGQPESWNKTSIHTGDNGYLDDAGYLHVNGRRKNLLISSYGRNINPEWVESEVLAEAAIAECVVFGDAQPYCCALLSTRNPDTPDDTVQAAINAANSRLPDYARIASWYRFPQALAAQRNLLTDNGRPKRDAIFYFYSDLIKRLYPDDVEEAAHGFF